MRPCCGKTWVGRESGRDFVALSLFAFLPLVGFVVADDLFGLGVPIELAAEADGDVGQVASGHGPMVCGDVADGQRAVFATLEEVGHVVARLLALAQPAQGILGQGLVF